MNSKTSACRSATAILCCFLIAEGDSVSFAQAANSTAAAASAKIPNEKLDSLVSPIALYPDDLLGQVLVASTYPLEIVELSQWLEKNKNLKPAEITQAVQQQQWDPSVQAMAAFPDIVKNMSENIKWTDELGNAFLAQQGDVMDAVQRMRVRAKDAGKLQSTEQQTVETQTEGNRTVVVIEQANPQVVYVPSYDPLAIWGAPVYYPYPPVYYPPGYAVAASAISFGVGVAIGAAWGGGGWGWHCGWGGNNITINNNNAFINHYNNARINGGNRYAGNGNRWQHNPQHRGGAPYGDRATAQRFGGAARGDNSRQNAARQNLGRGQGSASRLGGANGAGGIGAGGGRGGVGGGNRGSSGPGVGGIGAGTRGPGTGGGVGGVGSANRSIGGGMGGDRIGNRQTSRPSGGAFGGNGMGGAGARQSGQRGRSSMGGGMRGGGRRR